MHSGRRTVVSLSRVWRLALLLSAVALSGLLIVAGGLTPDRRGLGTHQQLGFPPCTIRVAFGMRCPACGMTTSWSHFARGELWSALRCNVAGTALAAAALVAIPWGIATAIRGEWVWIRPNEHALLVCCLSFLAVALTDWMVRLMTEHLSSRS